MGKLTTLIEEFINDNLYLMQYMSDSERFDNALYCVREALKNLDNKKILKELLKDAESHILDAEEVLIEVRRIKNDTRPRTREISSSSM